MIRLQRTEASNQGFKDLVKLLDAELALRDGEDHAFYHQFNQSDQLKYVVLANENGKFIGCGAIKVMDETSMEVKRMFVLQKERGKGVAVIILNELENWVRDLGYEKCRLETGKKQPEAIALYKKNGYRRITNYGQYAGVENSLCFEKQLKGTSK